MSVYHYDNARVAKRLTGFILIIIGVALITGLYYVKIRAQSAKAEVQRLSRQIAKEEAAIKVLKAELAHLESPNRLGGLSGELLNLAPTSTAQMAEMSDLDARFPRQTVSDAP